MTLTLSAMHTISVVTDVMTKKPVSPVDVLFAIVCLILALMFSHEHDLEKKRIEDERRKAETTQDMD